MSSGADRVVDLEVCEPWEEVFHYLADEGELLDSFADHLSSCKKCRTAVETLLARDESDYSEC